MLLKQAIPMQNNDGMVDGSGFDSSGKVTNSDGYQIPADSNNTGIYDFRTT